jgi:S-adenosylmethionine/arginine decarboxylase-like enzyme
MTNIYKSPPVGNNLSWIFWGIDKTFYTRSKKLENILREGLKKDQLTPLNWHTHKFGKDGYTMLIPLSESHLSVHTYKEYDSIAFGLYSCLSPSSGTETYRTCLFKVKPKQMLLVEHRVPVDFNHLSDLEIKTYRSWPK